MKPSARARRWAGPLASPSPALQHAAVMADHDPGKAAHWPAFLFNLSLLAGAVGVVAVEGWDLDGDGALTAHEALLVLVRLLAFPVHVLLQLTPTPVLQFLGVPDAPWPPSAAVAVALSLPLWGLLVCGALLIEARLEMVWEATGGGGRHARRVWPAGRPPGS